MRRRIRVGRSGPRLPDDFRTALALERGERVLAFAVARDESHVVVTDRALRQVVDGSVAVHLPWYQVARARWADGVLELVETTPLGERAGRRTFDLVDPGFVPETVRERVTANIVVSQHVALVGRRGIRIVGRRRPGLDGLAWSIQYDAGLDAEDPTLRERAELAMDDVRRSTGG